MLLHPREIPPPRRFQQLEAPLQSPLVGSPSTLLLLASFQTRLRSAVVFRFASKYSALFGTRHRSSLLPFFCFNSQVHIHNGETSPAHPSLLLSAMLVQ